MALANATCPEDQEDLSAQVRLKCQEQGGDISEFAKADAAAVGSVWVACSQDHWNEYTCPTNLGGS